MLELVLGVVFVHEIGYRYINRLCKILLSDTFL